MAKHQSRRAFLSVESLEDRRVAAVDAFIWFESPGVMLEVTGETKDDANLDNSPAFEIKDFSFGVENPTTIGSATGGAGAGKIKFNEFTIKKISDTASFEIKDFSFGVENPTTIGSATGGAGAGKIKFNEFTIKKTTDKASPVFFQDSLTGDDYTPVVIDMRKSGGDPQSAGTPFLSFQFDTVFTTKIDWSSPGDEGPEESIAN